MLRLTQKLLKYSYNGGQLEKYTKIYPLEVQKKKLKTTFKQGQKPEYLYDAKIKFDEQYKPYETTYNSSFLVGIVAVFAYLTYRYQKVRDQQGKTITHEYSL